MTVTRLENEWPDTANLQAAIESDKACFKIYQSVYANSPNCYKPIYNLYDLNVH